MLESTPPIVFCHYGNSEYLRYVLPCAVVHNPDRQVVLLGDDSNRQVARDAGALHIPFRDLEFGEDLARFNQVYQEIKAPTSSASSYWLNFVFKRWFLISNLIEREGISQLWHFDSDNMLLEPLSHHEHYFEGIDCTEQCHGSCLNGFINHAEVVPRFVRKINSLFENQAYLDEQRQYVAGDPRGHFNEMVAYCTFKQQEPLRRERLFQIRDDSIFDDAICHCEEFEKENLRTGESIKRLMVSPDGRFFGFVENQPERKPVRFVSLNLSWVPLYVYRNVYRHSLNRLDAAENPTDSPADLQPFRDLPIPISEFWKYRLRLATRTIRYPLKSLWKRITG